MSGPSIAAIVTTRDRPLLLADALASIAAQRVAPLEVRIADDGEGMAHQATPELGLLEVTVLPSDAGQPGGARNHAAGGARAELLAFLDDDDRWLPHHLADLQRAFAHPQVELAFHDVAVIRERVGESGRRVELERRLIAHDWDDAWMRRDDYIAPSAWMVRRSLFEQLEGFDESFPCSEDWDFLLRAAALTVPRRVQGMAVEVRMRDSGNLSADRGAERQACLEALARRHGFPTPAIKTFWDVAGTLAGAPGSGASDPSIRMPSRT